MYGETSFPSFRIPERGRGKRVGRIPDPDPPLKKGGWFSTTRPVVKRPTPQEPFFKRDIIPPSNNSSSSSIDFGAVYTNDSDRKRMKGGSKNIYVDRNRLVGGRGRAVPFVSEEDDGENGSDGKLSLI